MERQLDVLSVTTTPSAWAGTKSLGGGRIITALGLHPQIAHQRKPELSLFDELLPGCPFVGEVGLDGAPEFKAHWQDQVDVFQHVLASCSEAGGRIMSIHSRRASNQVLDFLEAHPESGVSILHWFSGTPRDLDRATELGCWFSVGPAMLRSKRGRDLVTRMPRERVLTESDGPFAQMDGRSIFPWEVDIAVTALAELWKINSESADRLLYNNLNALLSSD